MLLSELIKISGIDSLPLTQDREISSLVFDSRDVTPGSLFFALRGAASDGHDYIGMAVSRGAVAVVCQEQPSHEYPGVEFILTDSSHGSLGEMASAFYGQPSSHMEVVGVTGTNGKTTVATLLHDLFRKLGYKAGLISTVINKIDIREVESTHTTPDPVRLNSLMADMVAAGCQYCFMEVSSHSVVQERIRGIRFRGGVFTNLTRDHLDYHGTFADYVAAKRGFFDALGREAFALVNRDDRNGKVMVQNSAARPFTYALKSTADFKCRLLETTPEGMLLDMGGRELWTRFLGGFNAYNLTAVYGTAILLGAERDQVLEAISALSPVRGRFETLRSPGGVTAVVDYAHTPDALRNVLDTARELRGAGRTIVVVGCGGDRDRGKRPQMARIAVDGSDTAIFTSDNPRGEDPRAILEDMCEGVRGDGGWICIEDRREAIKAAMMMARGGDMVIVAGKGHENYQIVGDRKYHFDDREEILHTMEGL